MLSIPGNTDIRYETKLVMYPIATKLRLKTTIKGAIDASNIAQWIYAQEPEMFYREHFYVLVFNRANKFLSYHKHSTGGKTGTVVDIKLLFHMLLLHNADGFILVHNHPSGNRLPSQNDIDLTKKIKEVSKIHEISLLDHIIIANLHGKYYSFADEGQL